jgi:hypothetical protein
MKESKLRWMEQEFDAIWDSLEPEIREDMDRLDYRLRTVWNEAKACGVLGRIAERKMRERLIRLILEYGEEEHGQKEPGQRNAG